MSGPTINAKVSGLALTAGTAGLVMGCILVTYALCLGESQCPVFLPMISDTFVPIPGNYLSRMVFSAGQFGLGAVMVLDYYASLGQKLTSPLVAKLWLGATLAATVCLGIVGAVCESDTAPTCLSNGDLHSDSAMYLYLTLDFYALYCGVTELRRTRRTARSVLLLLLPCLSLLSKLRWVPSVAAALSPASSVALAVVEWADTAVLMSWLVVHCTRTYYDSYCAGYVTTADGQTSNPAAAKKASSLASAEAAPTMLLSASLLQLCDAFAAVSVGTVALTFYIATANGVVHPAQDWPYLSDLWADKPTNMISRYFVCLGAGITALEQAGHYFLAAPHRAGAPKANTCLHALSLAGLVGLSGVGACNEKETSGFHFACAGLFFGGMGAYMALDALWMAHTARRAAPHAARTSRARLAGLALLALGFNAYKLAALAQWSGLLLLPSVGSTMAVLEWTSWLTFLAYVRFHVTAYPDAPKHRLAILQLAPAPTALAAHKAGLLLSAA